MKKIFLKMRKTFTLIELSIVFGLVGIIGFFSIDFLLNAASRTAVANTSTDIVQFFKKVQNQNLVYGIPGMTSENQTYYGIGFKRDSNNASSYYSYRVSNGVTEILETFHLPNYLSFSNLDLNETLELRFCADIQYDLSIDPNANTGGLEYLCDDDGLVCSDIYEIDVKTKFGDYYKKVFINTSKTQYECKPEAYVRDNIENIDTCVAAVGCINGVIYPNVCEFEGEIVDYCFTYTPLEGNACECN